MRSISISGTKLTEKGFVDAVCQVSLPKSRFERTDDGARQGSDANVSEFIRVLATRCSHQNTFLLLQELTKGGEGRSCIQKRVLILGVSDSSVDWGKRHPRSAVRSPLALLIPNGRTITAPLLKIICSSSPSSLVSAQPIPYCRARVEYGKIPSV
jgi:hypothetical protein